MEEENKKIYLRIPNELFYIICLHSVIKGNKGLGLEGCYEAIERINNPILRWELRQIFGDILYNKENK